MSREVDVSYYPSDTQHWIAQHQAVLELLVSKFRESGTWPRISQLTRDLARQGQFVPLAEELFTLPRTLGFFTHSDDQAV